MDLSTPVKKLNQIGPKYQKRLKKLDIKTIGDLVRHFPYRYEDFSKIIPIADIKLNQTACLKGEIVEIKNTRTWKKNIILTQALIKDETASLKVVWFNQPYIKKTLKPKTKVYLAGKVKVGRKGIYLNNPIYEKVPKKSSPSNSKSNLTHTGRIIPIYSETRGLSSRWLRYILKPLLSKLAEKMSDPLPKKVIEENSFLPIQKAIQQIHFPETLKQAEQARERFAFEDLFLLQISVLKQKLKIQQKKAPQCPMDIDLIKKFTESLSFCLTDAQKKATWQILKNLEKTTPMSRLLEGDVGSGKTVIAVIAALNVAKAGYQVAFMAPTEILAKQHFKEVRTLLDNFKIKIGLLTGKEDKVNAVKLKNETIEISRRRLLKKLEKGEIGILVGTHTLIQEKVRFKNLGLAIVDEQHRFGVKQRAKLSKNPQQEIPHLLSMTATPIPRTLALTVYGDLDLSIVDEMPKDRKEVKTKVVPTQKRKEVYDFIKKEAKKGRGSFVICPRIESTDDNQSKNNTGWEDAKAVKEEYKNLSEKTFPDLEIGMLHGKMTPKQKEKRMKKFKDGKIDILVSTSVVEIGIDVPRATVMMIEGAERFGLAQLHQFRGRVGRSSYQSSCFLLTESRSRKTKRRLAAMTKSNDGFELAEKDMKIRGPGELYGTRQWGIPDLAMDYLKDLKLVEKTREAANEILTEDPQLKKHPLLKEKVKRINQKIHFE